MEAPATFADEGSEVSASGGTTIKLHGPYVTFLFSGGDEETYVARDLVHALVEVAAALGSHVGRRSTDGSGASLGGVGGGRDAAR